MTAVATENTRQNKAGAHQRPLSRVALIGCGAWGGRLARAAASTGRLMVVATVDAVLARAQDLQNSLGASWASNRLSDVWAAEDIDAVLVATPAATHFDVAWQAIAAGKHALVEKPLALSVAECLSLDRLAADNAVTLMVGHTFMYVPQVLAVKEMLEANAVGDLYYVHLRRLAYGTFRDDVNVTWNLGPHDVSILNHWSGLQPVAVRCAEHYCSRPDVADVAFLTVDYGAFFGYAHLSCVDPAKVRTATVAGSSGGIEYDDIGKTVTLLDRYGTSRPGWSSPVPGTSAVEPLQLECRHFAQCIVDGSQPRTNAMHAASVVGVLEAATSSALRGGEWVPVPPATPRPGSRVDESDGRTRRWELLS